MNKLLLRLRALWERIEAWFSMRDDTGERARDAHLYSEGRRDEMKKPEDWPP